MENIYVRSCYVSLWTIAAYEGKALIIDNPGIGKNVMLFYVMYKLTMAGKSFLYCYHGMKDVAYLYHGQKWYEVRNDIVYKILWITFGILLIQWNLNKLSIIL